MRRPGGGSLPSGTVTFVFTDIEASSMLLRTMGREYQRLLAHHHSLLRAVWRSCGGAEVNTEGDAFFVAFTSADDAVRAAAAAQRSLADAQWPTEQRPLVRIGIHTGWARPVDDDYVAMAVNQAARIVSAAHGGQTLISDDTVNALTAAPERAELVDVGRFRVRDFAEPIHLHRLDADGVPNRELPPRVLPADGHNLIRPITTFHSRSVDLLALDAVVVSGSIVSIVGPGGVGKTRIAVEHGLAIATNWADGVWFVDLARISPGQVAESVATAIGAANVAGRDIRVDLLAHVRDRRALIVLDNCEHVTPEAAQLAQDIIALAPGCGILATSRAPLGLAGETVHRLPPLESDGPTSPAVALFVDRAGPAASTDLDVVEQLCVALDGLPLSIELAASRAASLGPDVVLDRLASSVSVIRSNDPSLPERQRTLLGLLDWSWELLDDDARTLLTEASVLPAGFTLDLLERSWSDAAGRSTEPLDPLAALLDQSLIDRAPAAGDTRFVVPAAVRTYTLERSDDDVLLAAARRFGFVLLDRIGPARATTWNWLSDVDVEIDNLRAIIRRVAGYDDVLGQRLAWAIGLRHDRRSAFATGLHELDTYVDLLPTETPERTAMLSLLCDLNLRLNELDPTRRWLARAEACSRNAGTPPWDDTCVERSAGELTLRLGDPVRAIDIAEEALTRSGSPRSRARLLNLICLANVERGEIDDAIDALLDELAIEDEANLEIMRCTTRNNLAEAMLRTGNRVGAALHQRAALDEARANQDVVLVAFSVLVAAQISLDDGVPYEAQVLHTAGRRLLDDAGVALMPSDLEGLAATETAITSRLDAPTRRRAVGDANDLSGEAVADRAAEVLSATAGIGAPR